MAQLLWLKCRNHNNTIALLKRLREWLIFGVNCCCEWLLKGLHFV